MLAALALAVLPNQIAHQDIAGLLAQQPAVAQSWSRHVFASHFGTIHQATFSFPRPVGSSIMPPPLYDLTAIDPVLRRRDGELADLPRINRQRKGDALGSRPRPAEPARAEPQPPPAVAEPVPEPDEVELPYVDVVPPGFPHPEEKLTGEDRLYFGADRIGTAEAEMTPWAPGEAPTIVAPSAAGPEIKQSALTPEAEPEPSVKPLVPEIKTETKDDAKEKEGETIAHKGEVTGEGKRPMSPADRLKLTGVARAKAEKCLANAVYFESRGEEVRGQIAVAQVVMNRVFSTKSIYPNDVCGVVYQNSWRHLACQFTFACDGIPDVVTEPDMWERAKRIARDTLDGKLWLNEIAKSTHYHASWVRPSWVREMKKISRIGVHSFYRPRNWGDGSDEPSWGDAKATLEAAKHM